MLNLEPCFFFKDELNSKNGIINNGGIQVNGNNRIDIKLNQKDNEIEKLKIQLESCENENKKTLELVDELRQRLIDKDELIEMLKEKM